ERGLPEGAECDGNESDCKCAGAWIKCRCPPMWHING
nr:RecName: Full=Omega-agatoxin-Aa1b; Short=Omega-AGTX-Aa1b; AltName: Full=Omega-agatoxin IB; Short=Omega-Aga-IB; AltName: Full=Omega-agatoxin-1B [Agelenopsis aperta]